MGRKLEEVAGEIESAVETARGKGIDIVEAAFGVSHDGDKWVLVVDDCCPIGAYIIKSQPPLGDEQAYHRKPADHLIEIAAEQLGVSSDWVVSFIAGFDGILHNSAHDHEAYDVGAVFRARFVSQPEDEDEDVPGP